MPGVLTDAEARALCERVLAESSADGSEVRVESRLARNTRFARNQVSTSGESADTRITVSAVFGGRRGSVVFNDVSDAGIKAAMGRAEELARFAPEDREWMPLLGPQTYQAVNAFFERTHALSPADRAAAVQAITKRAERSGVVATGFLQQRGASTAVANSQGQYAYHRSTLVSLTTTVRTPDGTGSGWAGTTHNDWGQVTPPVELAERAIQKASQSTGAAAVEPGAYTVLLEPTAVGNLVQLLVSALGARAADEGRSYFAKQGGGNRIGEQVIDRRLSLISDPQDPDILSRPFTDDGQPVNRTEWITDGVLKNLSYSRFWGSKQGVPATPPAGGLKLSGGEGSLEDLVSTVRQGLLLTRFWYIRPVDRRTLVYTGLTRDGTFLIENGEITRAVKNLRFNESPMTMLNNVEAVGSSRRVVASESGGLGRAVTVPPMVVRNFRFTAWSDAV